MIKMAIKNNQLDFMETRHTPNGNVKILPDITNIEVVSDTLKENPSVYKRCYKDKYNDDLVIQIEKFEFRFPIGSFPHYVYTAVFENYYFSYLVTSFTQGRVMNELQFQYGMGKTTTAMFFSALINSKLFPYNIMLWTAGKWMPNNRLWDIVMDRDHLTFNIIGAYRMITPSTPPIKLRHKLWDDVALTAPKSSSTDHVAKALRGKLTAARPTVSIFGMTTASRNEISSVLRAAPLFEIIMSQRGYFEIQKVRRQKNFRDPEKDFSFFRYMEEGPSIELPKHIQAKYDDLRIREQKYLESREYFTDYKNLVKQLKRQGEAPDFAEEAPPEIVDLKKQQERAKAVPIIQPPKLSFRKWMALMREKYGVKIGQSDGLKLYRESFGLTKKEANEELEKSS